MVNTNELTAVYQICRLYDSLNFKGLTVGYIGLKIVIYRNLVTAGGTRSTDRAVASSHNRAAVGGGASRKGVVNLKVNVIKKVAEGLCFVRSRNRIDISD